jgi:TatA/E family protein of Tat protein translocase
MPQPPLPVVAALSWQEILMVVCAALLLFGAKKLPELARAMGSSVNEFKRGMKDGVPDGNGPSGSGPSQN